MKLCAHVPPRTHFGLHLANTTRTLQSLDDHLPDSLPATTSLHWWPSSKESTMKYQLFRKSLGKCICNRKHLDLAAGETFVCLCSSQDLFIKLLSVPELAKQVHFVFDVIPSIHAT